MGTNELESGQDCSIQKYKCTYNNLTIKALQQNKYKSLTA